MRRPGNRAFSFTVIAYDAALARRPIDYVQKRRVVRLRWQMALSLSTVSEREEAEPNKQQRQEEKVAGDDEHEHGDRWTNGQRADELGGGGWWVVQRRRGRCSLCFPA